MAKHIDGLTGKVFNSEAEYLAHVSPVTGFKPTDIRHQGKRGVLIAKNALKRSGSLNKKAEADLDKAYVELGGKAPKKRKTK